MMTSKCHHAIVCSCEKVHSHLFVRIGNNDKAECPHCQNAELLEALEAAKPWVAKCSADHDTDYLGLRASKVLQLIEETIRKAKEKW